MKLNVKVVVQMIALLSINTLRHILYCRHFLSTIELTHGYTNNIIAGWCVRPVRYNWSNVDEVGGMCNVLREVTHLLLKQSRRQFRPALDIGACV